MSTLDTILQWLNIAASVAGAIPGIGAGSKLAAYFLAIAQTAYQAHEKLTGTPLDPSKLHEIPQIP